mmetsp:Transcript_136709/g.292044  ORF Transcript_136709/g.292044 Transcript_136709/m.292044 type:complete len:200 (-) Transcript_136709:52-651(-)
MTVLMHGSVIQLCCWLHLPWAPKRQPSRRHLPGNEVEVAALASRGPLPLELAPSRPPSPCAAADLLLRLQWPTHVAAVALQAREGSPTRAAFLPLAKLAPTLQRRGASTPCGHGALLPRAEAAPAGTAPRTPRLRLAHLRMPAPPPSRPPPAPRGDDVMCSASSLPPRPPHAAPPPPPPSPQQETRPVQRHRNRGKIVF